MKKSLVWCLMIAASIFMATSVYAAGAQIGQGSSEAFGQLQFSHKTTSIDEAGSDDVTTKQATYMVGYGYFITNEIQLGISHLGMTMNVDAGGGTTVEMSIYTLDAFAKYHFLTKGAEVVPYLGIQAGGTRMTVDYDATGSSGSESANGFSYGAMGGLKYFFTDKVSFNGELNYRRYTLSIANVDSTTNDISLLLGFSVYF